MAKSVLGSVLIAGGESRLGAASGASASYGFDLHFDDIVLDTKPIACLAQ